MNLRKLWEDRIKSETSEEIVYGRFIGKLITDTTKKDEIEEYIGKIIRDLVNDLEIKEGMLILDAGVGPLARFTIIKGQSK
jgi:ribosomal protein L20